MPYVGEMCTYEQREKKMKNKTANYLFELIENNLEFSGAFIDARLHGNLSRFINHSCDFSCRFQLVIYI